MTSHVSLVEMSTSYPNQTAPSGFVSLFSLFLWTLSSDTTAYAVLRALQSFRLFYEGRYWVGSLIEVLNL